MPLDPLEGQKNFFLPLRGSKKFFKIDLPQTENARKNPTRLIHEGRFPAGERFHFLLSSWTLLLLSGNSLLVRQKAKFLHMNS